MNEIQKKWKDKWLQAIGQVMEVDNRSENDFGLHFDIWKVDEGALEECFSVFPRGAELLERAKIARDIAPSVSEVDDDVLLKNLSETNLRLQNVLSACGYEDAIENEDQKNTYTNIRVYRGNVKYRQKLFRDVAPSTESLDDLIGDLFKKHFDSVGRSAYSFLREPLYRIKNDTSVRNWIFWGALEDFYGTDPYAPEMELFKIGAESGWGEKEMFVFQLDS